MRSAFLNCSLSLFGERGKCSGIVHGEVCKNFSVEVYAGSFKAVHEFGIGKPG